MAGWIDDSDFAYHDNCVCDVLNTGGLAAVWLAAWFEELEG